MDLPILFTGSNVRAILEDRKTQTRRVVKPQPDVLHWQGIQAMHGTSPDGHAFGDPHLWRVVGPDYPDDSRDNLRCPYAIGMRLWVRETFASWHGTEIFSGRPWPCTAYRAGRSWINGNCPDHAPGEVFWRAPDYKPDAVKWKPSIFMPRTLSRILLEITDVRVQRVQDISNADAIAEGITDPASVEEAPAFDEARAGFRGLWDSINEKRGFGWDANPWTWALTFKRVTEAAK